METITKEKIERKQLVRDVKREALTRLEDAARTEADFVVVQAEWDKRDETHYRRARSHEIGREQKLLELAYSGNAIIPPPFNHPYWPELLRGEYLGFIYDNPDEIWQAIGDWEIARLVRNLTRKQRQVLFLSAVRLASSVHIACYTDKTDRAVRKLKVSALEAIRRPLAERIKARLEEEIPDTKAKRDFLQWYLARQENALDENKGE